MPLSARVGQPIGVIDGGKREILTGREAEMVRFILVMLGRLRDTRRGRVAFDFGEGPGTVTPSITESFDKLRRASDTPIAASAQG